MDKNKEVLLAALRQAMAEGEEHRLYRSGKLPGLFPTRTGAHVEAAEQALRDNLLELLRTETKGKTAIEWVRITPQGMDLVISADSPTRALDELSAVLRATQAGLPQWLVQLQSQIDQLGRRVTEEVQQISQRLQQLGDRVQQAIKRAEAANPRLADAEIRSIIWAQDGLDYLDRRRAGGLPMPCPLPDIFAIVHSQEPELTIRDFHTGLRRLCDRGVVKMFPYLGNGQMMEPEYALLEDSTLYYYVDRRAEAPAATG